MAASPAIPITVTVNGRERHLDVAPHETLLSVLRERLLLTGTKKSCGEGECGACTVLVDGRPVNSCIMLAVEVDGCGVTTIEGLERDGELHPLQEAFLSARAVRFPHRRSTRPGGVGQGPGRRRGAAGGLVWPGPPRCGGPADGAVRPPLGGYFVAARAATSAAARARV